LFSFKTLGIALATLALVLCAPAIASAYSNLSPFCVAPYALLGDINAQKAPNCKSKDNDVHAKGVQLGAKKFYDFYKYYITDDHVVYVRARFLTGWTKKGAPILQSACAKAWRIDNKGGVGDFFFKLKWTQTFCSVYAGMFTKFPPSA
jgi:hypothetical protein